MIKRIKPDNKIFKSVEFLKDRYKFHLILHNLESKNLELYSDEKNYVLCRGDKKYPTWIWTKDKIDKTLLAEIETAIDLYRLDVDTRFTCKKELYDLLVQDNFEYLGDYYFEMGYLVCDKTIRPRTTDGSMEKVLETDEDILTDFIYKESIEITDIRNLTKEEAKGVFLNRLKTGNYYVWRNNDHKIVAQAYYSVVSGNAKMAGVYTAIDARNKGYAANLIYNLTNDALNKGYHVSLYTDFKYIPSNTAYKNVGYVTDDVLVNFSCLKK